MITLDDLYSATGNGLKIIQYFYPQAEPGVFFAIREDDKTKSTSVKEYKGVYRLTDFGESMESQTPIDIVMRELNIKFGEALYWAAREFGVDTGGKEINASNVAKIQQREPLDDEKDGDFRFKAKSFSEYELKILGPKVTEEICSELGYVSLEYYQMTTFVKKKGKVLTTIVSSTDTYPIYMRNCPTDSGTVFQKIYQPLNPDKAKRFFYKGEKPQRYINGLAELRRKFTEYNEAKRETFQLTNPEGVYKEQKIPEGVYKEQKIPEAFIVSGERDALCLRALGYFPLWMNSETDILEDKNYKEITKLVSYLYNVPDIDDTGITKGRELATRHIEIFTLWLPKKLRTFKDNRGRPRKDLRDFVEIWRDHKDFDNLMNLAMPVKFWEKVFVKGIPRYEINTEYLFNFLAMNGFYSMEDKAAKTGISFIRIINNVVYRTTAKKVQSFIKLFALERYLDIDIRNLINNSTRISENSLYGLPEIELNFSDFDPQTQWFFFPNVAFEVKENEIIEHNPTKLNRYVWEDELINHKVNRIDKSFEAELSDDGFWELEIKHQKSNYMKFLINTCRINWRKELEKQFENNPDSEDAVNYRTAHKFDLTADYLTEEEREEHRQHFLNKVFALGYLFHRYKSAHRAWCVFAMDHKIGDGDECNGGSGKSVCLKLPFYLMKSKYIAGGNPDVVKNPHIYEGITEHTDMVLVDDADKYLPFRFFFDTVTGETPVNPKHGTAYTVSFEDSPKFGVTSNYTLDRFDSSTERRILYMVFSDYYHQKTDANDYRETRTIYDDFGKDLFRHEYSDEEWNADLNFIVDCVQFYLSTLELPVKIQPPMGNVTARNLRATMTDIFFEWASVYFNEESENCDLCISREQALQDFMKSTGQGKWTMNKFSKAIKAFAKYTDYVICLNPDELKNSSGRIVRKVNNKSTEMIYLQTKAYLTETTTAHTQEVEPTPKSDLPF